MHLAGPGLPDFDYVQAATPEEATRLLIEQPPGEARFLMGGTDLFVIMRDRVISPRVLIDVKGLPGMQDITFDPATGLQVGAAVDMNTMSRHEAVCTHYPLLVDAASTVASYQLRSRATMGGNLCNASPAADTAPAALVYEVTLTCRGSDGERTIPVSQFFTGPRQNSLARGELLLRVNFPPPPDGAVGSYVKLGRNAEGDLSIVGIAALGYPDGEAASGYRFRIGMGAVAPTPIRALEAEALLAGQPIDAGLIAEAAELASATAHPIDDVRASARYRKAMVRNLTRRCLTDIWNRLKEVG
jgi:CO/xanthine dehydrogenase FAD-binding subunit